MVRQQKTAPSIRLTPNTPDPPLVLTQLLRVEIEARLFCGLRREKVAPAGPQKLGVEEARSQQLRPERWLRNSLPMADGLSELYRDLLTGNYDCVDRIVLNGYFRPGHSAGGFRVWWQNLTGSAETLDNTHRQKAGIGFTQEGNCFTHVAALTGLAKIADTWSRNRR
jgi:hypothetical protein